MSTAPSDHRPVTGSVAAGLRGIVAPTGSVTVWGIVGVSVCAVAWSLAAAALVIYAGHGNEPAGVSQWLMDVLSAVVYGAATALMLPRTRHPVVWIILMVALGCGISGLVTQLLLIDPQPPTVDTMRLSLFGYVAWIPGTYGSLAVLPWLVLRGQGLASEVWLRVATVLGVAATATASLVRLTHEYKNAPPNPFAPPWEPWRR
ncbi:hypothetical protein, partial [Nocardioides sp.]|uniref:hypothetical protein n=1 Tax=Nocardioides sp. TaxID=35761 RepID=UPI001A27C0D1